MPFALNECTSLGVPYLLSNRSFHILHSFINSLLILLTILRTLSVQSYYKKIPKNQIQNPKTPFVKQSYNRTSLSIYTKPILSFSITQFPLSLFFLLLLLLLWFKREKTTSVSLSNQSRSDPYWVFNFLDSFICLWRLDYYRERNWETLWSR